MEALGVHRLQFAFTITYHYLFPQLTMGLTARSISRACRGCS
jgi:cytochrome bd-type quinol oxidase subunit 1